MTELEKATREYLDNHPNSKMKYPEWDGVDAYDAFVAGAQWQAKQSPWISIEERLPEYTQFNAKKYIAKVEYGSMVKEYQTAIVWMQNKFKFNIEMDWIKVTHWMEIPE